MPEFRRLAQLFGSLADHDSHHEVAETLSVLTAAGAEVISGADAAAISRRRNGQFETIAATSDLACQVDSIQYELRSGPCVDAILQQTVFRADDLRTDMRWPAFGRRAAEETGVLSMLSFRMYFETDDQLAGLNFYSLKPSGFDDEAETVGLLLSTHAAMAMTISHQAEQIGHLERALETNRDIGIAIGVLMGLHKVTKQQAFDLLKVASQHMHRKLAQIAFDVVETGTLEFPAPPTH